MGNWWGNSYFTHKMKYTTGWDSNGRKHLYYGKSIGTNFPGFPHSIGFVTFSHAMGNWWGKPCISHVMKYTLRWELNGKKVPILWVKYGNQFQLHFPVLLGNLWGNPCVSHVMKYTIRWESHWKKALILWEKYEYQFPRFSPSDGFCCIFPFYG